jgi:Domain of Unknown Function (DUF1080)/Lectin C-type domain
VRDGFTSLFNGVDLDGWDRAGPEHSGQWSVVAGKLEGRGVSGTATLATKRQDFRDYRLRVVYSSPRPSYGRIELRRSGTEKNTSGYWVSLGIRPHRDEADWPAGNILKMHKYAYGYAFPIGRRTRDTHAVAHARSTLEIEVIGDRIRTSVDGVATDDYADPKGESRSGGIALNCSGGSIVTFEEVSIRELPAGDDGKGTPQAIRRPANGPGAGRPADSTEFRGKHYKVFPQTLSWRQARSRCRELGGHLAIVKDEEQDRFLTRLVGDRGLDTAWLGATDEKVEGRWVWADGSPMSYSNWNPAGKQPDNKQRAEHYLVLSVAQGGKWSDQSDRSVEFEPGFICEWD